MVESREKNRSIECAISNRSFIHIVLTNGRTREGEELCESFPLFGTPFLSTHFIMQCFGILDPIYVLKIMFNRSFSERHSSNVDFDADSAVLPNIMKYKRQGHKEKSHKHHTHTHSERRENEKWIETERDID